MKERSSLFKKENRIKVSKEFSQLLNFTYINENNPEQLLFKSFRATQRKKITEEKNLIKGSSDFFRYRFSDLEFMHKNTLHLSGSMMITSEMFLIPNFYFDKSVIEDMMCFFKPENAVIFNYYKEIEIESNGNYLLFLNPNDLFLVEDFPLLMGLGKEFMKTIFKYYPGRKIVLKNFN